MNNKPTYSKPLVFKLKEDKKEDFKKFQKHINDKNLIR